MTHSRLCRVPVVISMLLTLALPAAASAQTLHRWTDDQGQVHITDDPNQIPERHRPKPPPPDPSKAAARAVEALKALGSLVNDEPQHEEYTQMMAETRQAVAQAVAVVSPGALRAALNAAMACYNEAAELWGNQLAVRRGFEVPLNLMPIRSAWSCGAAKTGEAERLLPRVAPAG